MKKCVKASIVIKLKSQVITLDLDKSSHFDLRNETDAGGNKIAPAFPFFCTEEEEPLSDALKSKLVDKMVSASLDYWKYELDRTDLFKNIKVTILKGLRQAPDAAKENISLTFKVVDSKLCGEDCEPADEEEDPELAPLEPEEDDEDNIIEDSENSCYSGAADVTYTLNGETKTERYRFYYSGEPDQSPQAPTLQTIDDYFTNYRGTNAPPDWLSIDGVAITKVEPDLFGPVFWLPTKSGCDDEPPSQPQPDDPVPSPEPSPPPSSPPAPQPKPDKVINIELDACDDKITANVGLYNKYLTSLVLHIGESIIDNVLKNREVFKKFSPGGIKTKSNSDSLIWIGREENAQMETGSSATVIVQDNGWGIFLDSPENSVDLPVGFRFISTFDLTLKFKATLNIKCGEETKPIPIFFGHIFDGSFILQNNNDNTTLVKFNKFRPGSNKFQLADLNKQLAPVLAKILSSADLQLYSNIIKNNNGLQYTDFVGTKIADSLKAVVVETVNKSKKLSGCDCCLQSISDIRIDKAFFQVKDITTLGGDSIFRPELRFGDKK